MPGAGARYQLAIGGVTEAQAAPSATIGNKTALMGATQNATQLVPWWQGLEATEGGLSR